MSTISRLALASGAVMGILSAGPVSAAMTDVDCTAAYLAADTNNDGYISEAEGARYFAFYRVANKPVTDGKLMKDAFITDCKAGVYDAASSEEGAPLEGANSFTEGQAIDRVVAHGGADVAAMAKDDKGVWRGTATVGGAKKNVAVDYKGNVVFTD